MYLRLYRSDDASCGNAFTVTTRFVLIRVARFTFHWRRHAHE